MPSVAGKVSNSVGGKWFGQGMMLHPLERTEVKAVFTLVTRGRLFDVGVKTFMLNPMVEYLTSAQKKDRA